MCCCSSTTRLFVLLTEVSARREREVGSHDAADAADDVANVKNRGWWLECYDVGTKLTDGVMFQRLAVDPIRHWQPRYTPRRRSTELAYHVLHPRPKMSEQCTMCFWYAHMILLISMVDWNSSACIYYFKNFQRNEKQEKSGRRQWEGRHVEGEDGRTGVGRGKSHEEARLANQLRIP